MTELAQLSFCAMLAFARSQDDQFILASQNLWLLVNHWWSIPPTKEAAY
jgi:hypothetical protein